MSLTVEIGCVLCSGPGLTLPDQTTWVRYYDNRENSISPRQAYQNILNICQADVCCMIHDDVTIHDPDWLKRIQSVFNTRPECVAVGLGGGTALGHPDLGKVRWELPLMARFGYASNQTDAEVHGARLIGEARVAVLDQFCMAVRTEWLRSRGGWPSALTHHCLDLWLACEARRWKKEIWIAGVSVTHHGGGSSTAESYTHAPWLLGGSVESDHQLAHRWIMAEYADVLPFEVDHE